MRTGTENGRGFAGTSSAATGRHFPASAEPAPGSTEGGGAEAMPSSGSGEAPPDSGAESPDVHAAPTARRRFSGQEGILEGGECRGSAHRRDRPGVGEGLRSVLPSDRVRSAGIDGRRQEVLSSAGKGLVMTAPRHPGLPSRNPCETTLEGFARGRPVFDPATRPRGGAARPAGAGG